MITTHEKALEDPTYALGAEEVSGGGIMEENTKISIKADRPSELKIPCRALVCMVQAKRMSDGDLYGNDPFPATIVAAGPNQRVRVEWDNGSWAFAPVDTLKIYPLTC